VGGETDAIEEGRAEIGEEFGQLGPVGDADRHEEVVQTERAVAGVVQRGAQASADIAADDSVEPLRRSLEVAQRRFELPDGELSRRGGGILVPGRETEGGAEQGREIAAGDADRAHGECHEAAMMRSAVVESRVEGEHPLEVGKRRRRRDHLDRAGWCFVEGGDDGLEVDGRALRIVPREHHLLGCEAEQVQERGVTGVLEIDEGSPCVASGGEDFGAGDRVGGALTALGSRSQGRQNRQGTGRDRCANVDARKQIEAKLDNRAAVRRRGESGEGIGRNLGRERNNPVHIVSLAVALWCERLRLRRTPSRRRGRRRYKGARPLVVRASRLIRISS